MWPLMGTVPDGYDEAYMHHVRRGRRVLALGYRQLPAAAAAPARALPRAEAETDLTLGGSLVLHCPPKPEAADVLACCAPNCPTATLLCHGQRSSLQRSAWRERRG